MNKDNTYILDTLALNAIHNLEYNLLKTTSETKRNTLIKKFLKESLDYSHFSKGDTVKYNNSRFDTPLTVKKVIPNYTDGLLTYQYLTKNNYTHEEELYYQYQLSLIRHKSNL